MKLNGGKGCHASKKKKKAPLKVVNMTCVLYSCSHAIAISEKQTEIYVVLI